MQLPVDLVDGVVLRLIETADACRLASAYQRNRAHLAPSGPVRADEFFTEAWQRVDIESRLAQYAAGASSPLIVMADAAAIGRVTLSGIVRGPFQSASVGYWIDVDHVGRGLASAALQATIHFARDELGLHRLEASTLIRNDASQRVLQRAGFQQIGLAPRYLQIAGEWQDHKLFQKILHD